MLDLIKDGLDILRAIYELRGQLKANDSACLYLADRAKAFDQFLQESQSRLLSKLPLLGTTTSSGATLPAKPSSLELSFAQLNEVLRDVHDFIVKYRKGGSWWKKAAGLAMNVARRNSRKEYMQELNQRLNDCATTLLPSQLVDIEEQMQKVVEDSHEVLVSILDDIVSELVKLGGQSGEQVSLLAAIRQDVTDTQLTASVALRQQLQEIETKVGQQGRLSHDDLSTLQAIMQTHAQNTVSAMRQENQAYLGSMQELQRLVRDLIQHADSNDATVMAHLATLELKVSSCGLVSGQELQDIKLLLSEDLHEQFAALQDGLCQLKLLPSMQRELTDIKVVLSVLASNTDQRDVKEMLVNLQAKIETKDKDAVVSTQLLQELRQALAVEHQSLLSVLESRLLSLNLLSPMQEQLLEVRSLLDQLKGATDQTNTVVMQRLQAFEQKLEQHGAVSTKELRGLRTLVSFEQQSLLATLENRLSSLDLLSDLLEDVQELKVVLQDRSRADKLQELVLPAREVEFAPAHQAKEESLGMGGFGQVRLGFYHRRTRVAIKTFLASNKRSAKKDREAVENEVLIMSYINSPKPHPNILLCYGFFEDQAQNMCIVLEYAAHGSLADLLDDERVFPDSIPLRQTLSWMDELASAVAFIHEKKVKHKDIKAQNILVFDHWLTKLCDFGMSKKQSMSTTQGAGTLAFMAPEVKQGARSSFASDVYSMGVTFMQILLRDVPRSVSDEVLDNVITGELSAFPLLRRQPYILQRLRRILADCTALAWQLRPPASAVSFDTSRLVVDLERDLGVHGIGGVNAIVVQQRAHTEAHSGQTSKEESGTVSSAPSSGAATSSSVPLKCLSHDEALQLLMYLGCAADLRQRLGSQVGDVDGEVLCEYDDIEFLQELEQDRSKLRSARLKAVLKKLHQMQQEGVPQEVLAGLRDRIVQKDVSVDHQYKLSAPDQINQISAASPRAKNVDIPAKPSAATPIESVLTPINARSIATVSEETVTPVKQDDVVEEVTVSIPSPSEEPINELLILLPAGNQSSILSAETTNNLLISSVNSTVNALDSTTDDVEESRLSTEQDYGTGDVDVMIRENNPYLLGQMYQLTKDEASPDPAPPSSLIEDLLPPCCPPDTDALAEEPPGAVQVHEEDITPPSSELATFPLPAAEESRHVADSNKPSRDATKLNKKKDFTVVIAVNNNGNTKETVNTATNSRAMQKKQKKTSVAPAETVTSLRQSSEANPSALPDSKEESYSTVLASPTTAAPSYVFTTSDALKQAVDMWCSRSTHDQALREYGDISTWNTSHVTSMKKLFKGKKDFNDDISQWDVSNVNNMSSMFQYATSFNQNIAQWSVGKVTDMKNMFHSATSFNQPIVCVWKIGSVTSKENIFKNATSFNQALEGWDASKAEHQTEPEPPLPTVTDYAFTSLALLKEAVDKWCNRPKRYALEEYGHISTWNTNQITSMKDLFRDMSDFNDDICQWDVSNVVNMTGMFSGASMFNQPIGRWNVSKVVYMEYMFRDAVSFNQPIDAWKVASALDMRGMFYNALRFDQPIGSWNVSKVTKMSLIFYNATSFNQSLASWDIPKRWNNTNMFDFSGYKGEQAFVDAEEAAEKSVVLKPATSPSLPDAHAGKTSADPEASFRSAVEVPVTAGYIFTSNKTFRKAVNMWRANKPSQTVALREYGHISTWNTNQVTNMNELFKDRSDFNDDISQWDVSNVTNMTRMFQSATTFNQPIGAWNVSAVTDMTCMFDSARDFNQNIASWNVSSVQSMTFMFNGARSFNQSIAEWNVRTYLTGGMFDGSGYKQKVPIYRR